MICFDCDLDKSDHCNILLPYEYRTDRYEHFNRRTFMMDFTTDYHDIDGCILFLQPFKIVNKGLLLYVEDMWGMQEFIVVDQKVSFPFSECMGQTLLLECIWRKSSSLSPGKCLYCEDVVYNVSLKELVKTPRWIK